jgi:hypothetical protein
MTEKKLNKVCKCEKCGNEAEMVITCSLEDQPSMGAQAQKPSEAHRVKGHGVCQHCGNEADIWVDLEP